MAHASDGDLEQFFAENFTSKEFAALSRLISEERERQTNIEVKLLENNYRILEKVGEGSFAEVYRVVRSSGGHTDGIYALKLLKCKLSAEAAIAFNREVANYLKISDDNVLKIVNFGVDQDVAFLVAEYADAGSLQVQIDAQKGRAFDFSFTADFLRQAAMGLHACEQAELVHFDIKPANLLMKRTRSNLKFPSKYRVLISDLGFAKLTAQLALERGGPSGTPLYYSPEMTRGASSSIGPQSDLFSLGIVAYEMLTGRYPFDREGGTQKLFQSIREDNPLLKGDWPPLPKALADTVFRLLSKSEVSRGSANDVVKQMEEYLEVKPPSALIKTPDPPAVAPAIHLHFDGQVTTLRPVSGPDQASSRRISIQLSPDRIRPRVIVTAESQDLEDHRKRLEQLVSQNQWDLICLGPELQNDRRAFRSAVEGADLVVVVQGLRYEPASFSVEGCPTECSYAELAFRLAGIARVATIAFVASKSHLIPMDLVQSDKFKAMSTAFAELLDRGRIEPLRFSSPTDLQSTAVHEFSLIEWKRATPSTTGKVRESIPASAMSSARGHGRLPVPPRVHAVPLYCGRTKFVGRSGPMEKLNRWLESPNAVLLVKALGGSGKSMLAWEWLNRHMAVLTHRFRAIFRYEFTQEKADFSECVRHFLDYVEPLRPDAVQVNDSISFERRPAASLRSDASLFLADQPCLIILDGVERLLHDYADDEASDQERKINGRFKSPEVGEFFQEMCKIRGSKILINTRLYLKDLKNVAEPNQFLEGCEGLELPDLSDGDVVEFVQGAEILFTPEKLIKFSESFGRHALTLGFICGLVADYPIRPHDFDAWLSDPNFGGSFRITDLNVEQMQEHILAKAFLSLGHFEKKIMEHIAACESPPSFPDLLAIFENGSDNDPPAAPTAASKSFAARLNDAIILLQDRDLLRKSSKHLFGMHDSVRRHILDGLAPEVKMEIDEKLLGYTESAPSASHARTADDLAPQVDRIVYLCRLGRYRKAYFYFRTSVSSKLIAISAYNVRLRLSHLILDGVRVDRAEDGLAYAYLWWNIGQIHLILNRLGRVNGNSALQSDEAKDQME